MLIHSYLIDKMYGKQREHFFMRIPIIVKFESSFINYLRVKCIKCENITDLMTCVYEYIFLKFLNKQEELELEECFCKIQKVYHGFCKLANFFKYKNAKEIVIAEDLQLTPFNELIKDHIIELYEDKRLYKFNIKNLVKIINISLSSNDDLIIEPAAIKNPYTNKPFNKALLYNIYFKVKYSKFVTPKLFYLFFIDNFDLSVFLLNNEAYLRDYVITNYKTTLTEEEKKEYVYEMIYSYTKLNIHEDFPYIEIYKTFSMYLHLYLNSKYSLNASKKIVYKKTLTAFLKKYNKSNNYGRKIYKKNKFTKFSYYFVME